MNRIFFTLVLLSLSFIFSCNKSVVENELLVEDTPVKFSDYDNRYYKSMKEDKFWRIIELSLQRSEGNLKQQLIELETELLKLSSLEIVQFNNKFIALFNQAYHWDIWGACETISSGGCGDTYFCDSFLPWLIIQGKTTFQNAIINPESLAKLNPQDFFSNEADMESIDSVPNRAHRKKFGHIVPVGINYSFDEKGERWSEENLPNKYPKLWEKFN